MHSVITYISRTITYYIITFEVKKIMGFEVKNIGYVTDVLSFYEPL